MNKYKDEQRLIFRDTIQDNLIGPGSDVFLSDNEQEIISSYPLSRYYSGILFPERESTTDDSVGNNDNTNANSELLDGKEEEVFKDEIDNDNNDDENEYVKPKPVDITKEYSEANQYFPTNFGLSFCVPKETKTVNITFSFAKYIQLNPNQAKIEIEKDEYDKFINNPVNPIKNYLVYENGFMFFNKKTFLESGLTVYSLKERFKQQEQQKELLYSSVYNKVDKLLGRLWQRVKQEPLIKEIKLSETNEDESKEIPLLEDKESNQIITCFYKKIYETSYGKFVKILMANRESQVKKKFSFSNEALNQKALFQCEISVNGTTFLPYKQLLESNPFDEELNTINFQYREEHSYGIGHGCAVQWDNDINPKELKTTFLPEVDIKNYSNKFKEDFPKNLKEITQLKKLSIWTDLSKNEIVGKLKLFVNEYQKWIVKQKETKANPNYQKSLDAIIDNQEKTYKRLIRNIEYLNSSDIAYKSFLIANTAMYIQMLISNKKFFGKKEVELSDVNKEYNYDDINFFKDHTFNPEYRPFQLAFFLLNIESTIKTESEERNDIVDLLWFPTGGGKTEAYLVLTAYTIASRRLLYKEKSDGVSVIMRYTLRLLTAQQFERATKLILSLDFLRKQFKVSDDFYFGDNQVSIGMWVGASTTPNYYKGAKIIFDNITKEITKLNSKKNHFSNLNKTNTFPITSCPWCGCNLISKNYLGYYVQGYNATKTSFETKCINNDCAFSEELPIFYVDDKIYKNPPTLLFATVDKFAMISHREEGHRLFNSLDESKMPPDLIIQDELHLLSGPLGSITGLYESLVELLSTKGKRKPKIITATATTRNTKHQIAMLYGNRKLNIFPPMGVTYDDNFFSYVSTDSTRKHIGFLPTGKTALNTQIQLLGNLFLARIKLYKYFKEKEKLTNEEIADKETNFWTIVSFYNSLKDIGKIYNKVPAEIMTIIKLLHNRFDLGYSYGFNYSGLLYRTKELTSRVESTKIKTLLNELEQPFNLIIKNERKLVKNTVDLVLASNMFSVGIDINRLNVMLMNGQPKNIAEYIQASSRVGRKHKGIVINLLDANRSRDKSYFENYVSFHNAYYKYVEPLSVTPFTEISLDKVLSSLLVCFVRHKQGLYKDEQAKDFNGDIDELLDFIKVRITNKKQLDYALKKLNRLSKKWVDKVKENDSLTFKNGLIKPIAEINEWSLMMSMREIDTNSIIKIIND
ncbi:MAG: helicase [Flavobacteriaceae bacterium]|nr:helicase [Flavobacteriaceae bacterium]